MGRGPLHQCAPLPELLGGALSILSPLEDVGADDTGAGAAGAGAVAGDVAGNVVIGKPAEVVVVEVEETAPVGGNILLELTGGTAPAAAPPSGI